MNVDNYRFEEDIDGALNLLVYLDYSTELSSELFNSDSENSITVIEGVMDFVKENFPAIRIKFVKVIVGTTLITTLALSPVLAGTGTANTHAVQAGDSLWKIASQYGISVEQLKDYNQLTSDVIYVGQSLYIPPKESQATANINIVLNGKVQSFNPPPVVFEGTTYIPIRDISKALGATVWWNAESQTIGINRDTTKIAFVIGSTTARVNGELVNTPISRIINNTTYVPARFLSVIFGLNVSWNGTTNTVTISDPVKNTYTVVAGDSLWIIANRHGTTISALKAANNLTSDMITVGQNLTIPVNNAIPTITYINHTVSQGDNIWDLSIQYGIPMTELLAANNLTMNSMLNLGQVLKIPVHQIPVKTTVSDKHGELLDWWTEAQYVFSIGTVAKVTDFKTGKTWYVKRTIGANHADSEPLTASDAAIMKEVWGGEYSWATRPIIVEVDGRRIAASMTSAPHDIQFITNNNFNGHFDIHFLNSTRHVDGEINWSHQQAIKVAAGV